ncbi:OLC1v1002040C1 [Oldenlandia corymbosa var. corymbosa]|uniref:OLC1v1002040C1 n=1 Tax=Oldenlandia corymbosa var. corymbosa TaxID=529605 RepID=A0AAV1D6T3_OLDCO|nr:OLC1v1002040C1 [Oldenlandia corymbosa var. corymbosa]
MATRTFFVCGNWKSDVNTDAVTTLISALNGKLKFCLKSFKVVVSPPQVFLNLTRSSLRRDVDVASQNFWMEMEKKGCYSAEISAEMLVNLGITWVIVGHSERRQLWGELDELVGEKVEYALSQGLKVIACVGENVEPGGSDLTTQIKAIVDHVTDWTNVVLAYQPAVGASWKVATEVHKRLREWLHSNKTSAVAQSIRIIYAGLTTKYKKLSRKENIDGFLVGEGSLTPRFLKIVDQAVNKYYPGTQFGEHEDPLTVSDKILRALRAANAMKKDNPNSHAQAARIWKLERELINMDDVLVKSKKDIKTVNDLRARNDHWVVTIHVQGTRLRSTMVPATYEHLMNSNWIF